jgi:hydrogenase maturation protein HypF
VIAPSDPGAELAVRVPPDRGLCADCSRELRDPADRRHRYPFTTCAACGPRFSVVEALPYDRDRLTLRRFPTCGACRAEYSDQADRRFHVEGIVCRDCGPRVELWDAAGTPTATGDAAVRVAAGRLRAGSILAVKGLGGFQLLARADRPEAVARLRRAKARATKPFAVMSADAEGLRESVTAREFEALRSPENPIVLLDVPPGRIGACAEVAPGLATVGVMLPTTPLHQLLLDGLGLPVIATSGNRGDEPLVTDESAAPGALAGVADGFLVHDRPIAHRADDSVVRVIGGEAVALRLARGFAPHPLPAVERLATGPPVLAAGGHQKVAVALWTGCQAVLGPHVGDLDSAATRAAFRKTIDHLTRLYGARPEAVACDLHPEYASTLWAEGTGLPVERVQHHHAHAAAVLAEHDRPGDEALALTWDGTGFGPDGTVWGGEVLLARLEGYRRLASLWPFPLPGSEAAVRDPRRTAFGMMTAAQGLGPTVDDADLLRHLGITPDEARHFGRMIDRGVNTPWTSSLGRLFDGVAALVLGKMQEGYEGEPAARLEAITPDEDVEPVEVPLRSPSAGDDLPGDASIPRADWRPLAAGLWQGVRAGEPTGRLAARFHRSVADWGVAAAGLAPGRAVVLGGGCFQNRRLREWVARGLRARGRTVLAASRIPPGDGGLAAGQLAVALARRNH